LELKKGNDGCSIDRDEPKIRHIYLIKTDNDSEMGFKVSYGNSTYAMAIMGALDKVGLTPPFLCTYEPFKSIKYKGIKLFLKQRNNDKQ